MISNFLTSASEDVILKGFFFFSGALRNGKDISITTIAPNKEPIKSAWEYGLVIRAKPGNVKRTNRNDKFIRCGHCARNVTQMFASQFVRKAGIQVRVM